jgi:hypothetical protein
MVGSKFASNTKRLVGVTEANTSTLPRSMPPIVPSSSLIRTSHSGFARVPYKSPSMCKIPLMGVNHCLRKWIESVVDDSIAWTKAGIRPTGKLSTAKITQYAGLHREESWCCGLSWAKNLRPGGIASQCCVRRRMERTVPMPVTAVRRQAVRWKRISIRPAATSPALANSVSSACPEGRSSWQSNHSTPPA